MNKKLQKKLKILGNNLLEINDDFHLNVNRCILMSRLGQEYLKTVGVKSEIVECGISAICLDENEKINYLASCARYDKRFDVRDGIVVPEVDGFKGHLVLIVEDNYMLDLSLHQFKRPKHNFNPPTILVGQKIYGSGKGCPLDLSKSVGEIVRHDFKLPIIFQMSKDNYVIEYYLVNETGWEKDVQGSEAWTKDITDCVRYLKREYKKG